MEEMLRADVALYQGGLAASRTAAQRAIDEGRAFANGKRIERASEKLPADAQLSIEAAQEEYVSRGAYKLLGALQAFGVSPEGLVCADIGASTGGFTQVLLRRGAKRVYAIDVGENQLARELLADERVVSMEHCNARELHASSLPEAVDLIVYDVSFISATLLYDAMLAIGAENARVVGLIKPQFEAGRQAVGKKGIVKRAEDHERAVLRCRDAAFARGLRMTGLVPSPIRGGDGNREYLCLLEKTGGLVSEAAVRECVKSAQRSGEGD
ncbi:MAG: TlyA family RNA methyltransferase [Eubacteriales bacterium]|nr:TlyA family RNA methyltransferase [Eubacteriales bacterium]